MLDFKLNVGYFNKFPVLCTTLLLFSLMLLHFIKLTNKNILIDIDYFSILIYILSLALNLGNQSVFTHNINLNWNELN